MGRKTKKQVMAEGFDSWTGNGVGLVVTKKPKKKTTEKPKKKSK